MPPAPLSPISGGSAIQMSVLFPVLVTIMSARLENSIFSTLIPQRKCHFQMTSILCQPRDRRISLRYATPTLATTLTKGATCPAWPQRSELKAGWRQVQQQVCERAQDALPCAARKPALWRSRRAKALNERASRPARRRKHLTPTRVPIGFVMSFRSQVVVFIFGRFHNDVR